MQKTKNLIWFTTNLRTTDNQTLLEAAKHASALIAVYVMDEMELQPTQWGFKKMERFRARFLLDSLHDLQLQLKALNIPLLVVKGNVVNEIQKIVIHHSIESIYHQKEFTYQENKTIYQLKNVLPQVSFVDFYDQFLWHPEDVGYKDWKEIPEVFTVFRKKGEAKVLVRKCLPSPNAFPENNYFQTEPIPSLEDLGYLSLEIPSHTAFPFKGGTKAAHKRIQHYFWETKKLSTYKLTRNGLVGTDYSSKLSAWLALGCISAKEIYWEIKAYEKKIGSNESTYWLFFELIWRDYFKYIALKHGNRIFYLSGILNKHYTWKSSKKALELWTQGKTNEAFVNANMIELQQTGWMSNRGRQNVASFWAKEWEQDWRVGAAYFESYLIDYDVHSNYGNWIYQSGVGNDPRDRKFNIKKQAEQYDPQQEFVKLWTE